MSDYLRVRDKDTGHEYTIRAAHFNEDAHTVIDKPALDAHGEPAAMKPRESVGKRAAKKTASSGTRNPASATEPAQEDSGRQADSEQEKS